MNFNYKGVKYEVLPYMYRVDTKDGCFYYGIKYSVHSANPDLFNINYYTSSDSIDKSKIKSFSILRTYKVNKTNYELKVLYLKHLEFRFLRFHNLIKNKKCLNKNIFSDNQVQFCNPKIHSHLKSSRMRNLNKRRMEIKNPMFNEETKKKMIETQKKLWEGADSHLKRQELSLKVKLSMSAIDKSELNLKISQGIKNSPKSQDYLRNNNPMFNEETKKKMIKTKMRNSVIKQYKRMLDLGLKDINDWTEYKVKYKANFKTTFYSLEVYKEYSNED